MSDKFDVLCLGSMDCFPQKNNDSSSYLINGHILVDTSYSTVKNLLDAGIDPLCVDTVVFTHLHFDHYAGLAGLLYYIYFHGTKPLDDRITLISAPECFDEIVNNAIEYFRYSDIKLSVCARERIGTPRLVKLNTRGEIDIGDVKLKFIPSEHPVEGRCYVFENASGRSIGFSGDTSYRAELDEFFMDVDCLFYEASYGTKDVERGNVNGHCSAHDCGRVAAAAKVKKLAIVHSRHDRAALVECASEYYDGEIFCPVTGDRFEI
ncbi:MAG: ribonuclease Z [Clostridiales bacterium]|nr:ribonuclease Z [Clostridiales bacterium]